MEWGRHYCIAIVPNIFTNHLGIRRHNLDSRNISCSFSQVHSYWIWCFFMIKPSWIKNDVTLQNFILKGVDLMDHTSIFLLRTINHYVTLIICTLSWFVPTRTSSEFFPTRVSPALRYPNKVVRYSAGLRTTSVQI